jgi:DNA (cytosine-5)-methyltransferase 1
LVRRTDETESGLLPTPTASNGADEKSHARTWSATYASLHNFASGKGKQLPHWKMYPTPSASGMPCEGTVRLARQRWLDGDCTLEEANAIAGRDVRDKQGKVPAMWPTPTSRDWKDVTDPRTWNCTEDRDRFDQLGRAVFKDGTATGGGALNPTWVEWLMGFPLGWTVCDASGTRSSRRSSKLSGEQ